MTINEDAPSHSATVLNSERKPSFSLQKQERATLDEEEDAGYLEYLESKMADKLEWMSTKGGDSGSLEKLGGRINLNDDGGRHYAMLTNPKLDKDRNQHTDRANRAVTEQVLDPRTRMILLKMINNGAIYAVNGCGRAQHACPTHLRVVIKSHQLPFYSPCQIAPVFYLDSSG